MIHSELHRQHDAHKDRQLRMLKAANSNGEVERLQRKLRLKDLQVQSLQHELESIKRDMQDLHMNLSDAHARILSQAKIICDRDGEYMPEEGKRPVSEIVKEVLDDYPGIAWDDIISVRRTRTLIKPRHACMKAVYDQRKDLTSPQIGAIFKRDHSSVLFAVGALSKNR